MTRINSLLTAVLAVVCFVASAEDSLKVEGYFKAEDSVSVQAEDPSQDEGSLSAEGAAPEDSAELESSDVDQGETVADLTQSVQELNRDLLILEEELLFPTHTQVAIFVSMDVGNYFRLDSLKLKIDDKMVASYLYTDQQVKALYQGGVQRLYLGNLKSGDHEISAFFTGEGPNGRDYKRGTTLTLNKGTQAKQLELTITDSTAKQQPEFAIREW